MAPLPQRPHPMSYLDRVRACNRLDLTDHRPFVIDGRAYGWVNGPRAAVLARHPEVFAIADRTVGFCAALTAPAARTAAVAAVTPALVASGLFPAPRGEAYAVKRTWAEAPAFTLDRRLIPAFGLRAFGVHVNGFVRRRDGLHLWIGTRAADREVEPGKLDNMVAGGQPAGLSLMANLVKECAEEADLPPPLARTAVPVGAISYAFSAPGGVKADTLFCYDLALPEDTVPRNADGEIAGFALMPLAEVLALVRDTERFKFNVNLVILDFAIRHGALDPDREPDFERLLAGLNRRIAPAGQEFIDENQ
jgi:hypothetical protein